MPIASSDILFRYSGGASNTSANSSLGGAMSTVAGGIITDDTINNLFPDVTGPQSTAGATHWRCIYVHNNHGSLTLTNSKIWIASDTSSGNDEVDIALDPTAIGSNSTITVTQDSTGTTNPTGVSLPGTRAASSGTALIIGDIPFSSKKAIWVRRTVQAGAAAFTNNAFQLQVSGETLA